MSDSLMVILLSITFLVVIILVIPIIIFASAWVGYLVWRVITNKYVTKFVSWWWNLWVCRISPFLFSDKD